MNSDFLTSATLRKTLSENFKYLYLMFADSPRFDGANYLLNTEGKIMQGLLRNGKPAH